MEKLPQNSNLGRAFQNLVVATASVTGQDFFRAFVQELAESLGFQYALVSELTDVRMERARTLALWAVDNHQESFEYDLNGTPCEAVSRGEICFVSHDVTLHFPNDPHLVEMQAEAYLGVPLRDANGKAIGILAALHNAPILESEELKSIFQIFASRAGVELERLQMQRLLTASEQRFRSLLEGGTDLILAVDCDGRIRYASPSCLRIAGFTPEEITGRLAFDFMHPDDRPMMLNLLCHAIKRPEPGPLFNCRIQHKNERWIEVESRANSVQLDSNTPGLVVTCRDVTEQVRLHEQVRHSQRLESIGVVSAGIAHEFKNILGPILGNAELARLDLGPEHPANRWLNQIIKSTLTARDLVQQILTFGRQAPSAQAIVSLGDVVTDAVRMLRVAIPKTVEISREIAENLPMVQVDPNQIHQVIMNLGINAWQAMPEARGQISITLDLARADETGAREIADDEILRLRISDNGKGMTPETLEHIFEPFFTTKAAGEGTGLGLSVVHGIVKSHHGYINVTSSPGAGTTFEIYLPSSHPTEKITL